MNDYINSRFRELADTGDYRTFNKKIVATNYEVLGVRTPDKRALAREIAKSPDVERYLETAEFTTYEHVTLYGAVLGYLRKMPIERILGYLDGLIPRFDCWAHVDVTVGSLKIFERHRDMVLDYYLPLKTDPGEFTKRTFVIILMCYLMDDDHIDATLRHFTEVPQGQYYVDMALAWALSVALVKYYDKTLPLLERPVFTRWVHNKAIQKARESFRISPEQKEYLNGLKIK